MKGPSSAKRSVSPFGTSSFDEAPLSPLELAFRRAFNSPASDKPLKLKTWEDAGHLPAVWKRVKEAPANDALELVPLCHYILSQRAALEEKQLFEPVYEAMRELFEWKTQVFMVDHYDREACAKMGWADESRDVVLFSKERDQLVGGFFAPVTEREPGRFSEFITKWSESADVDRVLHFLDFLKGAKDPTFEHYLLFTHPALSRILANKNFLRSLSEKAAPLMAKLSWRPPPSLSS